MDGRLGGIQGVVALAVAALIALAGCGGEKVDPNVALDRAVHADYSRIQVQLGFQAESPASGDPDFPQPATSINVDPSAITLGLDTTAGRWYARIALPLDALGMDRGLPFPMPVESIDVEAIHDGTDLYVKSPLLALALQGNAFGGMPLGGGVDLDVTGWVRLGGMGAVDPAMLLFPFGLPGNIPQLPALPLPSPGDAPGMAAFLGDLGATVEYVGSESVDGVELVHLRAGISLAKLVDSRTFQLATGIPKEMLQGAFDASDSVAISLEIWTNRATGRLATLRLDGRSLETEGQTVAIIVRIADPAPGVTFEAPRTFAELDLSELMGNQFPGVGMPGFGVGGGVDPIATPTEAEQEAIEDILEQIEDEIEAGMTFAP